MSVVFPIEASDRLRIAALSDGQTAVTIPFPFQADADIAAFRTSTTGAVTALALSDDYTLSGAGEAEGGTLTLMVEGTAGETVTVFGAAVLERLTSIVREGRYASAALDADLDRLIIALQEAHREIGRAPKVALGQTAGAVRPGTSGNLVRWGDDGDLVDGGIGAGPQGQSAYQVAVAHGFVGSEADWLASLHGADGTDGADGAPGEQGPPGDSARVALTEDTTYHVIDYPSPGGVGGGTGTGTELDPFVGPQYALDWIKKTIDSAGYNVRLNIDSDFATENSPNGFTGLIADPTPMLGGGYLIVDAQGHSLTCSTVGEGIVDNSYDFVEFANFVFEGSDDDVYFDHFISAGISFLSNPSFGRAGFGSHMVILSTSEINESGEEEIHGGAWAHVKTDKGSRYINTSNRTVNGTVDFLSDLGELGSDGAPAFAIGNDGATLDFGSGTSTINGSVTGVRYRLTTGTSARSVPDLPGDTDGVLDQTSSYNGVFGGGGGAVDSVNGQTGTVVLDADDIDDSATTHKFATAAEKAAIAALGTAADATLDTDGTLSGNSDSAVASQKATKTYVDQIIAAQDAMVFKGVIDCSANPNYPAADRGHTYRVSVAGKIGGASGTNVEAGDLLLCLTDSTSSGNQATVGSAWSIAQANLDGAVIGPSSATSANLPTFNGTSGKLLQDSGKALSTDGTFAANSDAKVPTEKAINTFVTAAIAALSSVYQGLNAALTAIAGLSPSANDVLQYKSGAWTNRTPAQLKTDLSLTKSDVGLSSVTNDAQLKAADLDTDGTFAANSDTKIASQKATKTYVDQIIAAQDAMVFKGVIDCSANPNYPAADRGHTYRVSVAGKIGGASGVNVEAGDLLLCLTDSTTSGNQATVGSAWSIAQANIDGAVVGPSSVTDGNPVLFDGTTGKLIKQSTFSAFKTSLALAKADISGLGTGDSPQFAGIELGNASDTTLTRASAGQLAVEGVNVLMNGGALGTPSSGTLTNASGLPVSGIAASTSIAIGVGSVELGHASDTTLSRASAGVLAVEGVAVPTVSSTSTFTNKRTTPRRGSTTSSATPTINTDNVDVYSLTAQAANITSMSSNLSGSPNHGDQLLIEITGTASRTITWGSSFEASTVALPTTTSGTAMLSVLFVYNSGTSKWRCVGVA